MSLNFILKCKLRSQVSFGFESNANCSNLDVDHFPVSLQNFVRTKYHESRKYSMHIAYSLVMEIMSTWCRFSPNSNGLVFFVTLNAHRLKCVFSLPDFMLYDASNTIDSYYGP